jgi:hypothetical protein
MYIETITEYFNPIFSNTPLFIIFIVAVVISAIITTLLINRIFKVENINMQSIIFGIFIVSFYYIIALIISNLTVEIKYDMYEIEVCEVFSGEERIIGIIGGDLNVLNKFEMDYWVESKEEDWYVYTNQDGKSVRFLNPMAKCELEIVKREINKGEE